MSSCIVRRSRRRPVTVTEGLKENLNKTGVRLGPDSPARPPLNSAQVGVSW